MPITSETLQSVLSSKHERYHVFPLSGHAHLVIAETRGRIFGPFSSNGDSLAGWVSPELCDEAHYTQFLLNSGWNVGGSRIWVAPEFPFFTKERARFLETYTVQKSIDPGHYHLSEQGRAKITLQSELYGDLYEHAYPGKTMSLSRCISCCENPLQKSAYYPVWMENVAYCGYREEITLRDTSPQYAIPLSVWNLCQVQPGGTYLLPYHGDHFEYVDYYAPSMGTVLETNSHYAKIRVSSSAEHKIGALSYQTIGRIGYILPHSDGDYTLLVRNYSNDPSDANLKEPSDQPGKSGCSLFVYMNDTRANGFSELETTGSTLCAPDSTESTLRLSDWFFIGSLDNLKPVIRALLNIELPSGNDNR